MGGDPGPSAQRGLLVLDFDGTLWRGNAALEIYAAAVAPDLAPSDRGPYLEAVHAFLGGERWRILGAASPPDDGWAAVASFAAARGAPADRVHEAFLATRARIAAGEVRLEVPDGLVEFLTWSRRHCAVVLATNSPASSVVPVLAELGLAGLIDEVASEAHKPGGLVDLVTAWAGRLDADLRRVMSVGDHYRNDIEPAVRAGWFTAYITPWRWVPGPCSLVGTTMEEVLPGLYEWVSAVAAGMVTADSVAVEPRAS